MSRVVTFRQIDRRRRRYNARGVIAPRSSYPARDNGRGSFRRRRSAQYTRARQYARRRRICESVPCRYVC